MTTTCGECGLEIETSFVWTLDEQPVCGDCMRLAMPAALRGAVSFVERLVEPVYRARKAASRN